MKQSQLHGNNSDLTSEKPLQSWKEIGAYLEIGERTARRWEKGARLPVRRHGDGKRSSVYAYPSEIEAWRLARKPASNQTHLWRWGVPVAIGVLSIVLGGWFILYGPVFNPPNPLVEAADGITLRQVCTQFGSGDVGDVSLDGRFLTYTDWKTGDLAIRDLEEEVNRRVTNKGSPAESREFAWFSIISPDGQRISYTWHIKGGDSELRLLDLNQSETQVLYRRSGGSRTAGVWARPIDWLPDGSKILVGMFREYHLERLVLLSTSDQSIETIATSIWKGTDVTAALSPDGKQIVYDDVSEGDAYQRDVFMLPIDGGPSIQLVHHPADDYSPIWSPDGRCVLFVSDRTGNTGFWMIPITDGRPSDEPKLVKSEIGPLQSVIGCTRQGDLYYSLSAGMEDIYLFEIDPDSGEVVEHPSKLAGRYVGANMGPVFSPDGKSVAYQIQRAPQKFTPGALSLVVRSLKTGKERELRPRLRQYGPVRWFPDGESVLVPVLRDLQDFLIDYYRINLESNQTELIRQSEPMKLTSYHPDLSTDGKTIFFTEIERDVPDPTTQYAQFKKFDIESRTESVLHSLPSGKIAMSIQLSPNEKAIAWVEQSLQAPYRALNTKPVQGGSAQEIFSLELPEEFLDLSYGFVWAPNGKSLLVTKFTRGGPKSELLRVPLDGGEPSPLGISMARILFGDVHKNGRLVAFYSGQQKGTSKEIWAMGGFLSKNETSD